MDVIGCFVDDPERDFEFGPHTGTISRSYELANAFCLEKGYKYASIQNGHQVFCNHEFPSYPMANPEDCEAVRCADDPENGCGSAWRQVVLKVIDPPLGLIDCDAEKGIVMIGAQESTFSLSGPVKGWGMRATSRHPQVVVSTNDVLSICPNEEQCKFYYDSDVTPILESVSPSEGIEGELLTVNFDVNHWKPRWMNETTITIAGEDCPVLEREDYSLTCEVGRTQAGVHYVVAHVAGIGSSLATVKFKSLLKLTKVSPSAGSVKGGTILVIEGKGFAAAGPDNTITVGDVPCVPRVMDNTHCKGLKYEGFVNCDVDAVYGYSSPVVRHYARTFDFSNYERIECVVGGGDHDESKVALTVTVGDQKKTLDNAFEFSLARTPVIETINPNPAAQSVPIQLRGYNLEADPVLDKQWYMNIWGFYERFPNVSVFLDNIDVATKTYDRQIFGKNLCFIGDVTTEDRMGKHQQWSETNATHITCTIGDVKNMTYPVHVYIHGKGFAQVKTNVTVGVLVSRVEPSQVSLYGGLPITIYGSGFSRFKSHNRVSLGGGQKCSIMSVTHTKIVCRPSAAGKEQTKGVTVFVTCGNLAFCNAEPQPSNKDVQFSYSEAITPTMIMAGNTPIFNPDLGPAVAPGTVVKMNVSLPDLGMNEYVAYSEAELRTLIKVWLGGKSSDQIVVTQIDNATGVAMMEGVLPERALGYQTLQVELPTGRSAKQTVIVFPHVGTPDINSTGLGGGLVVTLKNPGIGGWMDNNRQPRLYHSLIHDGKTYTFSNCYPHNRLIAEKRLGPVLEMSTHKCMTFCKDYRFFGLQNGNTCICSNSPPSGKAVVMSKCNSYCASDFRRKGNKCGGNWYVTLFERCCHTDIYLAPEEWPYIKKTGKKSVWATLSAPRAGR